MVYILENIFNNNKLYSDIQYLPNDEEKNKILTLFDISEHVIRVELAISYYIIWKDLSIFEKHGYLEEKKALFEFILKDEISEKEKNDLIVGELEKLFSADEIINSVDMLQTMSETMPGIMCSEKVKTVIANIRNALKRKTDYLGNSTIKDYAKKLVQLETKIRCP